MHEILNNIPGLDALTEERLKLQRARDAHRERSVGASDRYRRETAEYQERRNQALLAGEEPPEPPTKPEIDPSDAHMLTRAGLKLDSTWNQMLADDIDRIEAEAGARERELLNQASEAIQALNGVTAEMGELVEAVRLARRAAGSKAEAHPGKVVVEDVVRTVNEGRSLLRGFGRRVPVNVEEAATMGDGRVARRRRTPRGRR